MNERRLIVQHGDGTKQVMAAKKGERKSAKADEVYHMLCMVCQVGIGGHPYHELVRRSWAGTQRVHAECVMEFGKKTQKVREGATL